MKKSSQSGFAHVGLILLLIVILGIAGGGGYYIWHKNKDKSDSKSTTSTNTQGKDGSGLGETPANMSVCEADGVKGKYLISYDSSKKAQFGFCAPNGWNLQKVTDSPVFQADASGLSYKADGDVKVSEVGGGDGARAFSVVYNTSYDQTFDGYTKVGTVESAKLTGTEYYKLHNTDETGLGAVDKGTKEYAYYFVKDNKSVLVTYNIFPGDTDNTAVVNKLVKTVNIDQ